MRRILLLGLGATFLAAPAGAAACADRLHQVLESGSIRAAARPERIEEPALEALRKDAGAQFIASMNALCAAKKLGPAQLQGVRQVVILQGSACTDVCVWREDTKFGGGAIVFQYVWAEEKLKLPPKSAVDAAIACWAAGNCEPQN